MEAYLNKQYCCPSVLDQMPFLPSTPPRMISLLGDMNASSVSYYQSNVHQSSSLGDKTGVFDDVSHQVDSFSSFKNKTTSSSISLVVEVENDESVAQGQNVVGRKRKNGEENCSNSAQSKVGNGGKGKKQGKCTSGLTEEDKKPNPENKNQKKTSDESPSGYFHVRARRGQATDSHSLAERVRREKISERMKLLQSIVPGCDKMTGKAHILDEIINYVQSLQNQVEFLSLKLASTNPALYDYGSVDSEEQIVQSENFGIFPAQVSSGQQSNHSHPSAFADSAATSFPVTNNYSLLETAASAFLHGQTPNNTFSQDNGNLLWDIEEQGRRFLNPAGVTNLCSFH